MAGHRGLTALLVAAALVALPAAAAADRDKDESGKGRGGHRHEEKHGRGDEVKHEWKSGDCKYEYKAGRDGVKEEYKCEGGGRGTPVYWIPPGQRGRGYYTSYGPPPLDLGIGRCNREIIGQLLGGAAGAAAGSQIGDGTGRIVAIVGGTLAGVLLGGEIGRSMDRADQLCIDQALEFAPDGRSVGWVDPDSGGRYEMVPRHTYESRSGRYCREYTAVSRIGGRSAETYGTACRQPDGSWQIVN